MEDTDNPAELETEVDEVEEQAGVEPGDTDTPEGEPEEPENEAPDDDLVDVEIDGKTFRVPKDAAFRQSDYTQKTQALADQRKDYEQAIERLTQVSEGETKALANVAYLEAQVAQYNDIDWNAWDQSDPAAANRARWELTELNRLKGEAVGSYNNARQQSQIAAQQETAKRLEQGYRVLSERIPGWGQDKATAILDFGQKTYGFSREQLQSIDDPLAIMVLHDAMEFRKAQQQTATANRVAKQQAVKPAATIKGKGAPPSGLDDRLSADEWLKRRNAQVRGR